MDGICRPWEKNSTCLCLNEAGNTSKLLLRLLTNSGRAGGECSSAGPLLQYDSPPAINFNWTTLDFQIPFWYVRCGHRLSCDICRNTRFLSSWSLFHYFHEKMSIVLALSTFIIPHLTHYTQTRQYYWFSSDSSTFTAWKTFSIGILAAVALDHTAIFPSRSDSFSCLSLHLSSVVCWLRCIKP